MQTTPPTLHRSRRLFRRGCATITPLNTPSLPASFRM
jgi:hypothetical protein